MTSQLSDGVFQVALASYALFSDRQPSAAAVAAAAAVVLLPFSLLGPFVGVLLDRWSRRQVLVVANLVRFLVALVAAAVVAAGLPPWVLYAVAVAGLGVNRFLLSGLSAALPHTVPADDLVAANAVTPTLGTAAFVAGLGIGGVVRGWSGGSESVVLATAGVGYLLAGVLALRLGRAVLGPDHDVAAPSLRHVLSDLGAALSHLRSRPGPTRALLVIGSVRFWTGLMSVVTVLVLRNHLYPDDADRAFAAAARFAAVVGGGYLAGAVLTPFLVRRLGRRSWVLVLLLVAAVAQAWPATTFTEMGLLVSGALLGLAAQGVKVCVDAEVQGGVDDDFRGRVFSLYDVLFNVAFVAAAATAAVAVPADGTSVPALLAASAGYLLTALLLARARPADRTSAQRSGSARP